MLRFSCCEVDRCASAIHGEGEQVSGGGVNVLSKLGVQVGVADRVLVANHVVVSAIVSEVNAAQCVRIA